MAGNVVKPSPEPAQDNVTNDELLVERFKAGDASAFDKFDKIVEEYSGQVAMLANRLLGWSGDVEDVVQDVFLSVFVGLKKFSHAPYFTGKRGTLQQFALFFPKRLVLRRR